MVFLPETGVTVPFEAQPALRLRSPRRLYPIRPEERAAILEPAKQPVAPEGVAAVRAFFEEKTGTISQQIARDEIKKNNKNKRRFFVGRDEAELVDIGHRIQRNTGLQESISAALRELDAQGGSLIATKDALINFINADLDEIHSDGLVAKERRQVLNGTRYEAELLKSITPDEELAEKFFGPLYSAIDKPDYVETMQARIRQAGRWLMDHLRRGRPQQ